MFSKMFLLSNVGEVHVACFVDEAEVINVALPQRNTKRFYSVQKNCGKK